MNDGSVCIVPEYVAEDLLRTEGFTDIRYGKFVRRLRPNSMR